jgi:hypothetical protein
MSYTGSTSMIGLADPAINQNATRDVASEIRYLAGGAAPICKMVEGLILDSATGQMKKSGGLLKKESVESMRFENYSRSARPTKFTVSSGTEITSAGVVLANVNGLQVRQTLYNPRNKTECRVEVIASTTITGQTVGSTTFSCQAGDELIAGTCPIPSGSTTSIPMNGTDDHSFNIMKYVRSGVSMTDLQRLMTPLAGGDQFAREKKYMLEEFLQRIDNDLINGHKSTNSATVNYTAGAQTGFTTEKFFTTDGIIALAANSFDMLNNFSLSTIRHTLPLNMGDVYNENDDCIALVSNEFYGRVQEALEEKHYNVEKEGILDSIGIKTLKLLTDGVTLELVKHSALNSSFAKTTVVIFQPKNMSYCYLKGCDMDARAEIQDKKTLGREDEIVTTFGLRTYDAGQTITVVSNCF